MIGFFKSVGDPWWDDKPVILVGAGPSLKDFNLNTLWNLGHVVGINGAMYDLPFADAWVTLDCNFIRGNADFLNKPGPQLYVITQASHFLHTPQIRRAIYLQGVMGTGRLSEKYWVLESGGTSGFAAFNLAYLKKAKTIYLFGFDYTEAEGSHYCPERYKDRDPTSHWRSWANAFSSTWVVEQLNKAGVKVVNASPNSVIDVFPRVTPYEALEQLRKPQ